jgi:hypothetical protein
VDYSWRSFQMQTSPEVEYLKKPRVKGIGVGGQKQEHWRNLDLLAPAVIVNITHSPTPRQINRKPFIKVIFTAILSIFFWCCLFVEETKSKCKKQA